MTQPLELLLHRLQGQVPSNLKSLFLHPPTHPSSRERVPSGSVGWSLARPWGMESKPRGLGRLVIARTSGALVLVVPRVPNTQTVTGCGTRVSPVRMTWLVTRCGRKPVACCAAPLEASKPPPYSARIPRPSPSPVSTSLSHRRASQWGVAQSSQHHL